MRCTGLYCGQGRGTRRRRSGRCAGTAAGYKAVRRRPNTTQSAPLTAAGQGRMPVGPHGRPKQPSRRTESGLGLEQPADRRAGHILPFVAPSESAQRMQNQPPITLTNFGNGFTCTASVPPNPHGPRATAKKDRRRDLPKVRTADCLEHVDRFRSGSQSERHNDERSRSGKLLCSGPDTPCSLALSLEGSRGVASPVTAFPLCPTVSTLASTGGRCSTLLAETASRQRRSSIS